MDWLPDDLEICSVEQVPHSTLIAIIVHSNEFKPLYSKMIFPIFGFAEAKAGWERIEDDYAKAQ